MSRPRIAPRAACGRARVSRVFVAARTSWLEVVLVVERKRERVDLVERDAAGTVRPFRTGLPVGDVARAILAWRDESAPEAAA